MEDKRLRKQDQARTKARERRSNENQAILDLQYTLPMNGGLLRTVDKATVLRLTNRYMLLRYQLSQLLPRNRTSPLRSPVHRSLIVVTIEKATGSILYVSPYLEHITRHAWYGMIGQPLSSFAMEPQPWREGDLVHVRNNCPAGGKAKHGDRKELSVLRVVSSLPVGDLNFYLLHWLHLQPALPDTPAPAPLLRYAFVTFHQADWKVVRAHSRVFGLDESSLEGKSLFDCVHVDDIAPLYQSLQRLTDKHSHVTTDCCRWKIGQGYVWVVIHATQVHSDHPSRITFACQHEIAHSEDTPPELLRPSLIVDTSYSHSAEGSGDVIEEGHVDWWPEDCVSAQEIKQEPDTMFPTPTTAAEPPEASPLQRAIGAAMSVCSAVESDSAGGSLRRCSSSRGSLSSTNTIVNVEPNSPVLLASSGSFICEVDEDTKDAQDMHKVSLSDSSGSGGHTSLLYRLLQNREDSKSAIPLPRSSSSTAGSLSPVDGGESCLEKMDVLDDQRTMDSLAEVADLDDCLAQPPLQSLFEDLCVEPFFPSVLTDTSGLTADLDLCSTELSPEALLQDSLA